MHRIDAPGATITEQFTEGNPSLGIPATEVSDDWLNDVQEELCNVIEDQGITLVKATQTQLLTAILSLIGQGGSQLQQAIANNQVAAANVVGLLIDKNTYKSAQIHFDIHRQTDSVNYDETGIIFVTYDPVLDSFELAVTSQFDDAGVVFSIAASGQIQYTSSNMAGTNYAGTARFTHILKTKQTL